MGSGKTSWAIQHMEEALASKKFIYITPFKSEVERVLNACANRRFVHPENNKGINKPEDIK
ncbi:hypothetical protein [Bacillus sp. 165]|uniref:hypothetical protein n=1 Tax=Bacillus sp. 165 TaxID=1529117 RepID=UPI001ADBA17C|nr:hypothetical protein [Bacillus sp. 165]MBO9129073.1 hypothetical protein [Bacillus sp. 165]